MLATRTGRWSIGAAILCVVLLVTSWFFLVAPRRAQADDLAAQVTAADERAGLLRLRLAELRAQYADLPAQQAKLERIRQQLPPSAQMSALVRDLQDVAGRTGVSLNSITPGTPAVVPADASAASSGAQPASGQAPGQAAGQAGSLVSVPLAMSVTGDWFAVSLFLKRVQTQVRRSYLITSLSLAPAPVPQPSATAPVTTPTEVPTPAVIPVPTGTDPGKEPPVPGVTQDPTPPPTTPSVPATQEATGPTETQNLDRVAVDLSGSVFVLLDGTSSLDDVAAEAKQAAGTATAGAAK